MPNDGHCSRKNCQSLEKVPLAQVNLIAGEEQWRLLHRMTGPRDQVRNSRLHVCLVYIEKPLQKLLVLCCFFKLQPKIASWTADQLQGLGQIRFQVERIIRGRN